MSKNDINLERVPLFEGIQRATLDKLENRAWQVEGETNDPIYYADDSASLLYILKEGRARIYYATSKKRDITLDFLDAGEVFGELSLMDFETRGEAAETLEPSVLTVVPGKYFRRIMEKNLDLFRAVFDFMNHRRWRIQNRLKTLAYEDARKKIIYVMLDLGRGLGIDELRPEPTTLEVTHSELADMSGLARPTTTKILNSLKDDGLITMGNGEIDLLDPVAMKDEISFLT